MKIYFHQNVTTDGSNSGPDHNQIWTEHMVLNLGAPSLAFGYYSELCYPRLDRLLKRLFPTHIIFPNYNYVMICRDISTAQQVIKIGVTGSKGSRIDSVESKYKVVVLKYYRRNNCTKKEMLSLEKQLHERYRKYLIRDFNCGAREFFDYNDEVLSCIEEYGFKEAF